MPRFKLVDNLVNQYHEVAERFVKKHGLDIDSQNKALVEELGELNEALNKEAPKEQVNEEICDIIFVATTITSLEDIDQKQFYKKLNKTFRQNMRKNKTKDGKKVTKETELKEWK